MKPLLRKIFFWDAPAQGAFFGLTLLMTLLTIGLGTGCVSTTDAGKNPSRSSEVMSETLLQADLSDASSCRKAGKQRGRMAMTFHHGGNNSQAKAFLLEAISLQEQAVASRSQLDKLETEQLFIELAHSCKAAKKILSDEPEAFQTICGRTSQHIKSCLDEVPKRVISVSTLEYHLVVLYLLMGDQKKAFLVADDAWRDGYRNWDADVREQVRNYMLDNGIAGRHLPPPKPRSTLQGKLLFPVNVLSDMLVDAVSGTVYGFYVAGGWFADGKPGVGLFTLVSTPIVMPVVGCMAGVDDAWRGRPFWTLKPPAWREEF